MYRVSRFLCLVMVAALVLMACGANDDTGSGDTDARALVEQRLDATSEAISEWSASSTIAEAHAAAERARNLITGLGTFGAGDLDGDGQVRGGADNGLLPSETSRSSGLATLLPEGCVADDVLGGSWEDPVQRWATLRDAIAEWRPDNNTFPELPSHPQRIVGWATLTLDTDDLALAHEYAGHARLHLDVSRRAIARC